MRLNLLANGPTQPPILIYETIIINGPFLYDEDGKDIHLCRLQFESQSPVLGFSR